MSLKCFSFAQVTVFLMAMRKIIVDSRCTVLIENPLIFQQFSLFYLAIWNQFMVWLCTAEEISDQQQQDNATAELGWTEREKFISIAPTWVN